MTVGGMLSDCLRKRKVTSDTNVRKFFNTFGFAGQAIFLLAIGSSANEVIAHWEQLSLLEFLLLDFT